MATAPCYDQQGVEDVSEDVWSEVPAAQSQPSSACLKRSWECGYLLEPGLSE